MGKQKHAMTRSGSSRRRFLRQSAALLAAAGAGASWAHGRAAAGEAAAPAAQEEKALIPIVDTHQHLWDLDKFRLPWLSGARALKRSYLMADFFQATRGLNVVKSVYMEVDVEASEQLDEFQYVVDICKRGGSPMVGAVVSGRPASDGFADYLAKIKASPFVKGMRQVLHRPDTPPGFSLSQAYLR
ncbi:MAG TPA: amidohydrolase, partial [Isosphaeraceae bacterium]|nr:amidohydrolase [Isosphaeraceae bacterium]